MKRPSVLFGNAASTLVRAGVRGASIVAPRFVERQVASLMTRPRRPRRGAGKSSRDPLRVPFRDGSLALWVDGPSAAPLVLMVHGWESDSHQFDRLVAPLLEAGLRVARFDQPAHGRSTGRRSSVLDFRDAVLRVAEHVGPVSAIVAHSLGAAGASIAISRGLRVQCVVLYAPVREPSLFVERLSEALGLPARQRANMLALVQDELGPFDALDVAKLARDRSEPLLVVHSRSRTIPFPVGAASAAAWPGAQLHAPEGLGHFKILSDPGSIHQTVDFVRAHVRPPAHATAP
jgi:pimeloyl-ACP methyl ester carboxylesterase